MTSIEKAHEIIKQSGGCQGISCDDNMSPELRCPCITVCDEFTNDISIDDMEKLCLEKAKQFIADEGNEDVISALIAAAPDMYKALEKAVEEYGKPGGPWNVPSEPGSWITLAKAALAKARGE
ncbi:MAG TPA: hypothetical protein DE117_07935 [Fervidobacterium sp.]|nr:hypothetical protein [Fervidobacterium sp.]